MKTIKIKLAALCILCSFNSIAQPYISSHAVLENNNQNGKLEIGFQIFDPGGLIINPYDPDNILIEAWFTHTASGVTHYIPGFFYRDFSFSTNPPLCDFIGDGDQIDQDNDGGVESESRSIANLEFLIAKPIQPHPYRVRFSPPMAGNWQYTINVIINHAMVPQASGEFNIDPTNRKGFIRKKINPATPHGAAFEYTDGTPYFPVGTNLEHYTHPYCFRDFRDLYCKSITDLASVGVNYTRMLISGDEWRANEDNGSIMNIEWGASANLGNYDERQNNAFLIDSLMHLADKNNINLQLCLFSYNELSSWSNSPNWQDNPFQQLFTNGWDFFYHPQAIKLTQRRLRYIMARWGYATNLFAWELINEPDLINENLVCWNNKSVVDNITNWMKDMSMYIKGLDANHLITYSSGKDWHTTDPNAPSNKYNSLIDIDFIEDHTYRNSEFYFSHDDRRYHGLEKINDPIIAKPVFASEFGNHKGLLFTRESDPNHENIYAYTEFHAGIWASTFSGVNGTSAYWWSFILDNPAPSITWDGQYVHFRPLTTMLNAIDWSNSFTPISTGCSTPSLSHLSMSSTAQNYFHALHNNHFLSYPPTILNETILPIDINNNLITDKLLLFGLKTDNSIFGWMQKRDNFWWKLPHRANAEGAAGIPYLTENCSYNGGPFPTYPSAAACNNQPLSNTKAIFRDVCDGEYEIKYYSTFPQYPTSLGGPRVDGGIIPSFTRRIFSTNNKLTVILPTFAPLDPTDPDHNIFAPDYGYHLKKIYSENYHDIQIGSTSFEQGIANLETFYRQGSSVTKIFFEGFDDYLHYYWWDFVNSQWVHGHLVNNPPASHKVDGDIAVNNMEEKVFYRGPDGRVHHYYYVPNQWIEDCLPAGCNSPANESVAQDSYLEATDDQVFYKGTDDKMHLYFFSSGSWHHTILSPSATSTENVAYLGDIEVPESNLVNSDIVFFVTSTGAIATYARNWSNNNPWSFTVIGNPLSQSERAVGQILPVTVANELYCFYTGQDENVQYYKQTPSGWVHGWVSQDQKYQVFPETNLLFYHGDIYFATKEEHIHRYYWDNIEWRHSTIIPCDGYVPQSNPASISNFRVVDGGNFVYVSTQGFIREIYNSYDCEICDNDVFIPYALKTTSSDVLGAHLESKKDFIDDNQTVEQDFKSNISQSKEFNYSEGNSYIIKIYPNPASDQVSIMLKNVTENRVSVKIFSMLGNEIRTILLSEHSLINIINVDDLPRGLYFFNISESTGRLITSQKVTLY